MVHIEMSPYRIIQALQSYCELGMDPLFPIALQTTQATHSFLGQKVSLQM